MHIRKPLTEKQLRERDAKRDLGAELLQSVREMKAGKGTVVTLAPKRSARSVDPRQRVNQSY